MIEITAQYEYYLQPANSTREALANENIIQQEARICPVSQNTLAVFRLLLCMPAGPVRAVDLLHLQLVGQDRQRSAEFS